jgi:Fic family protein
MQDSLKHWEHFINERGKMPELLQCVLIHEHFEAIHPFIDGNGRIGRLLITLFLVERGRLSKPLLYLSSYFERHRAAYYELLQRIRTDGDWDAWLSYFLTAVRDIARSAISQGVELLKLRDNSRTKLRGNHRAMALLDELFVNPYITAARAAATLKVSLPTAQKALEALEKIRMLKETTGRTWGRIWVARPILRAIEGAPLKP